MSQHLLYQSVVRLGVNYIDKSSYELSCYPPPAQVIFSHFHADMWTTPYDKNSAWLSTNCKVNQTKGMYDDFYGIDYPFR